MKNKNHKVVDIKITYEPENMQSGEEENVEEKIKEFLEAIKGRQGVKTKATRHTVDVHTMVDEYGIDLSTQ